MSAEQVKRSQYFNPPTTECPHSSRNHFEDWEEFHLPMARMHHAALHGRAWPAARGERQEAGTQIEVSPGVAVNRPGRADRARRRRTGRHRRRPARRGGQQIEPPFRLGTAGRESGTHYLCIQFAQALRFTEGVVRQAGADPLAAPAPDRGRSRSDRGGRGDRPGDRRGERRGHCDGPGPRRRARAPPPAVGAGHGRAADRRTATAAEAVADAPSGRIAARRRRRPAAQRGRRRRCDDPGSRGWRALLEPRSPGG